MKILSLVAFQKLVDTGCRLKAERVQALLFVSRAVWGNRQIVRSWAGGWVLFKLSFQLCGGPPYYHYFPMTFCSLLAASLPLPRHVPFFKGWILFQCKGQWQLQLRNLLHWQLHQLLWLRRVRTKLSESMWSTDVRCGWDMLRHLRCWGQPNSWKNQLERHNMP